MFSTYRSSYSASLTFSVLEYGHENGRRYHKYRNGSYLLPNEESENDRLGMLHELCLQVLHRRLYLAPITKPQKAIDLATGSSIWAIDFADQHPQAEVICCDPIQPTLVRPNVKFLVGNIEDFGKLIKQCYWYVVDMFSLFLSRHLTGNRSVKPGGWVEFQDWDDYPNSEDDSLNDTWLQRYYDEVYGAFEEAGYEVRPGVRLEQWFKDAGFVNIHAEKLVVPYGVWSKDRHLKKLGAWNQSQAEANGYEGTALAALTRR
ncbi:hypothetical protein VTN49DRAFT_918 [Thermomyces lanuginosus]|uniref:uncharacterized protein n=1 Tax=Thermomyces lanuginosus TaxID=5541 RepID=UPI0037442378